MAKAEKIALTATRNNLSVKSAEIERYDIKSMIYVIRNQQVMIDSDLAMLYPVETKRLNEAVKRNISRFPEEFRFQLTQEEAESLWSQIATLNENGGRGKHRKYLPYVLQSKRLQCFLQYC